MAESVLWGVLFAGLEIKKAPAVARQPKRSTKALLRSSGRKKTTQTKKPEAATGPSYTPGSALETKLKHVVEGYKSEVMDAKEKSPEERVQKTSAAAATLQTILKGALWSGCSRLPSSTTITVAVKHLREPVSRKLKATREHIRQRQASKQAGLEGAALANSKSEWEKGEVARMESMKIIDAQLKDWGGGHDGAGKKD